MSAVRSEPFKKSSRDFLDFVFLARKRRLECLPGGWGYLYILYMPRTCESLAARGSLLAKEMVGPSLWCLDAVIAGEKDGAK